MPPQAAALARGRLEALGIPLDRAFLDVRGNRWRTLFPERPLVPGRGNVLRWGSSPGDINIPAASDSLAGEQGLQAAGMDSRESGSADAELLARAAWSELLAYLAQNATALRLDVSELGGPRLTVGADGDIIQIYAPRQIDGVPVRDCGLTAVVNGGNLVLLGTRNWADIRQSPRPRLSPETARTAVESHLAPTTVRGLRRKPGLVLLPMAAGRRPDVAAPGTGYQYRLVWVLEVEVAGHHAAWEALVDAQDGELLAFEDKNRYATARSIVGGIVPLGYETADPVDPEQPGYPMAGADVVHGTRRSFTDAGGNLPLCVDGEISTSLDGRHAQVVDVCGPLSESSLADLDLGTSPGADCDAAIGASSGNTRSSRTVFYELNRMREQAAGQLAGNNWLDSRLIGITNFPADLLGCNAFWDGSTVTFFVGDPAFPPEGCRNTGELATVVSHEWAHGLDDNDANGEISTPGEGFADILSALRFNNSCIGRGFFNGVPCDTGDGDPCQTCDPEDETCLTCDGVREIDWAKRVSGLPHTPSFIDSSCPPGIFSAPGPCGGAIHCEGALESESAWDLVARDLPARYSFDQSTALEIATRLYYLGSGLVESWFQCEPGIPELEIPTMADGCNADSGYLNLLAVDDDNGSLVDGTPHMQAIYDAFDRHGIACDLPAVMDGGCAGAPNVAPLVVATPVDRGMKLTWGAVAGAQGYGVFRSEGVLGCDSGKIKVGETAALEFVDQELLNGFDYHYVVIPLGTADTCMGPASACITASPASGPNVAVDPVSSALNILAGDGDAAIDNCEVAELTFDFHNIGLGALTNLRMLGVDVVSHPGTVSILTSFPAGIAATLAPCGTTRGGFVFSATDLSFNDALVFEVRFTADELAGLERSARIRIEGAESDITAFASKTFSFETDMDGWQVVQGTFVRTSGEGGDGTNHHLASSSDLSGQCDQVRSPLMRLAPTSTLSLWSSFDIEGAFTELPPYIFWFDRANVALSLESTGQRIPVSPDGGRLYNAGGTDGSCVTQDQDGWADSMLTWAASTWSSTQLGALVEPGQVLRLDVGYGTDDCGAGCDAVEGSGIRFDQVTITDVELVTPDTLADICLPPNQDPLAVDDVVTPPVIEPVTVAVLANDEDPDVGDLLRVFSVGLAAAGDVSIDSVGPGLDTVTYTPRGCTAGLDLFDYAITDGRGGVASATVTVDLTPLSDHAGTDLVLTDLAISGHEVFVACASILTGDTGSPSTDDDFRLLASADVVLQAGESVAFGNGTTVASGASLTVVIDP
jgi:hypothetical protein